MGDERPHKIGDIVDGFILGADSLWHHVDDLAEGTNASPSQPETQVQTPEVKSATAHEDVSSPTRASVVADNSAEGESTASARRRWLALGAAAAAALLLVGGPIVVATRSATSSTPVAVAPSPTSSIPATTEQSDPEPYPDLSAVTWADFVSGNFGGNVRLYGQIDALDRRGSNYWAVLRGSYRESDRPFNHGDWILLNNLTSDLYRQFDEGDMVTVTGTGQGDDWYVTGYDQVCSQKKCYLPAVDVWSMEEVEPPPSDVIPYDQVLVTYFLTIKDGCGSYGYNDIKRGTEVEVFDGSQRLLGFGNLKRGKSSGSSCTYSARFRIERSTDRLYRVTAGNQNRGFLNFKERDLISSQEGDTLFVMATLG